MARKERVQPKSAISLKGHDLAYAVGMVETICWLAGTPNYLDDVREAVAEFFEPSELKQSRRLFEWLATQMSFQGISDEVARNYMDTHGSASWSAIARSLKAGPECPLLDHYWSFEGCGYQKSAATCYHPQLLHVCPLPTFAFRNGRMNQLAYSLFLFIRDVAGGNLVAWIDDKLSDADRHTPTNLAESVIAPMRGIFGVSDKVLNMVMSSLLIAGTERNPLRDAVFRLRTLSADDQAREMASRASPTSWLAVVVLVAAYAGISLGMTAISGDGLSNAVSACNSERIKTLILNGTFTEPRIQALKKVASGEVKLVASAVDPRSVTVNMSNIRQISYDPNTKQRRCVADYAVEAPLTEQTAGWLRTIGARPDQLVPLFVMGWRNNGVQFSICNGEIFYTIQATLDGGANSERVGWRCVPRN